MTIGRKIGWGFAVIILLALGGAAVSVIVSEIALNALAPIDAQFLPAGKMAAGVESSLLNARIHFIYYVTIQKDGEKEHGWEFFRSAEAQFPELEHLVGSSPQLAGLAPQLEALRNGMNEYRPVLLQIVQAVDNHQNTTPEFAELRNRWATLGNKMVAAAGELSAESNRRAGEASRGAATSLATARLFMLIGGGVMLLISGSIAVFLIRRIGQALGRASATLAESSARITNTAGTLSESARTSADRASQQAASVEETSAATHEISAMATQNVDHAKRAAEFTRETGADSAEASSAVTELVQAMTSIAGSARSISGVLRIIDELAFQTNILALNAAVEAARAGEAGAGFAVVADEVRNLAQRSAAASKDTAKLVDESMASVSIGQERLQRVDGALHRIVERIGKLSEHVNEVARSSAEQTSGLAQISTAIASIEQAAQQSAAAAEERAAASEELTSDAGLLRTTSMELASMVGTATDSR
jgi:hypothetical protein